MSASECAPAAAAVGPVATRCSADPPTSVAQYQYVADHRSERFGVGDITSAVRLPDGRRLFLFGDTGYYNVLGDGSAGPLKGFGNNSAWVQYGNCITLLAGTGPGTRSWIVPPQSDGSVYWPGAAVVAGNRVHVFLTRLFLDNMWGTPVGSAVATFELPSLQLAAIHEAPFMAKRVFGAGGVYDGGYVYAYASQARACGLCFTADMYVARVAEDRMHDPAAWRYRSGSAWVTSIRDAKPVLANAVSNTNVQRYGNGFLLLTKTYNIVAPSVRAWFSPNPIGPWQDLGEVLSIPEPPASSIDDFTYQGSFTYGPVVLASAHLDDGGALGAYNVGTFADEDAQRDGRMLGPRFVSIDLPPPPEAPVRVNVTPRAAPWTPTFGVDRGGRVRTLDGSARLDQSHTTRAVAVARTPTGRGGWVGAADGGVITFGDAEFAGSMGGKRLNKPIVGIAATPTGKGYWLVATDGGIFSFGDAKFFGSTGSIRLNKPIAAMAATPTGKGYWLVASDGGIFTYGDARFYGSLGRTPPAFAVSAMATTANGRGYWLVTAAGQVYTFGNATYGGNGPVPPYGAVVGIVRSPEGYRLIDTSGRVHFRGGWPGTRRIATPTPLVGAG
jgi:hypothetical protein